ncbi:MAG TPA: HD-GYP domain-containing protein [Terriglobia bacterium]|nr:HD-GYP domain-containing protein [Terriglobia bacterium]
MTRQLSLEMRAFLFAFVPMGLTLVLSFVVVSRAVESRIKDRLRASLQETEMLISRRESASSAQVYRSLSTLSENSSLKAGIGLLRENPEARFQEQARETLARQLERMGGSLGFELLLFEDSLDQPVIGIVGSQRSRFTPQSEPVEILAPSLVRVRNKLYEAVSVPINNGTENLGTLIVGNEFDIRSWSEFGKTALIQNGRVLLTTFADGSIGDAERQVHENCVSTAVECEVRIGGETYLSMPIRQETFKDGVRLLSFQSIDAAAADFTRSFQGLFPLIGGGGVLLVFLSSAMGARLIAGPLVKLLNQLRREGSAGGFTAALDTNYRAAEVNELAMEFSRAAGAVRESARLVDQVTEEFIESMAQAQDARDPYTAGHSERVSLNSTAVAQVMGLREEEVDIIRIGAKLHDIGKIGIPDAVLRKPGRLTREEYVLIQRHPEIGREILEKVGRFKEFLPIVELHHENPDGSGYPFGLREQDIPLGVRIVHVVDVYDAITTDRAYRKAMTEVEAWDLIRRGTGRLFDAEVVDALWTVLRKEEVAGGPSRVAVPHENDFAFYSLSFKR